MCSTCVKKQGETQWKNSPNVRVESRDEHECVLEVLGNHNLISLDPGEAVLSERSAPFSEQPNRLQERREKK